MPELQDQLRLLEVVAQADGMVRWNQPRRSAARVYMLTAVRSPEAKMHASRTVFDGDNKFSDVC